MAKIRTYQPWEQEYALSCLQAMHGNFAKAAKQAKVEETALRYWAEAEKRAAEEDEDDEGDDEGDDDLDAAPSGRPMPPDALADKLRFPLDIVPAPEVAEWLFETFVFEGGPLYNPDHMHLGFLREPGQFGVLWTNYPYKKMGKQVVGLAEMPPRGDGHRWANAREEQQYLRWFGQIPKFLLTFDAPFCAEVDNLSWCRIAEHELYHCGQRKDDYGTPKWTKEGPAFGLMAHGCEEHPKIVERYGIGTDATQTGTAQLVAAANRRPLIGETSIADVCGSCIRSR